MKKCPKCNKTYTLNGFHNDFKRVGGKSLWCKSCVYKCVKKSKARIRTSMSKTAWAKRIKDSHLRTYYGITLENYFSMLKIQKNRCKICKTLKPTGNHKMFVVDHNHKTGKVRELLCSKCNTALGLFNDSFHLVKTALNYLQVK